VESKSTVFDLEAFLTTAGEGREMMSFLKGQTIFAQGDASNAIFIVQVGLVTLSARLQGSYGASREAIIDIVGEKDFLGKDSIRGEPIRTVSARALTNCRLLRIGKETMKLALEREVSLANVLCAALLARNAQHQQDLVDRQCNYSEKRLARLLVRLSELDARSSLATKSARISHTVLAEMVGTTRSRVCFFMKKFEAAGLIDYAKDSWHPRVSLSLLDSFANNFRSYT
jgi:CRP/FNR family cyclic AMP-dependent transcriptional regulator